MHTPNKNLFYLIKTPSIEHLADKTREEWKEYLLNSPFAIAASERKFCFGKGIVYNDYADFADKVTHYFKSI